MKNDDETRVLKGIPEGALFIIIYTKNICSFPSRAL